MSEGSPRGPSRPIHYNTPNPSGRSRSRSTSLKCTRGHKPFYGPDFALSVCVCFVLIAAVTHTPAFYYFNGSAQLLFFSGFYSQSREDADVKR